jgi:hypothetical protein
LVRTFQEAVSIAATRPVSGCETKSREPSGDSAQSSPGLARLRSASSLVPPKPSRGLITETVASSFSARTW